MRIDLGPEFVVLDRLIGILVGVGGDVELLSFGDMPAALVRLLQVLVREDRLLEVGVNGAEPGVGGGELGVQINRQYVELNAFLLLPLGTVFSPVVNAFRAGRDLVVACSMGVLNR